MKLDLARIPFSVGDTARLAEGYVLFHSGDDIFWAFDLADCRKFEIIQTENLLLSFWTHVVAVKCRNPKKLHDELTAARARMITTAEWGSNEPGARQVADIEAHPIAWCGVSGSVTQKRGTIRSGRIEFSFSDGRLYHFDRSDLRWLCLRSTETLELGFTLERVVLIGWRLNQLTKDLLGDKAVVTACQGVKRHVRDNSPGLEQIERHAYTCRRAASM